MKELTAKQQVRMANLSEDEQAAIYWLRRQYPNNYRMVATRTRIEHEELCPPHICTEIWAAWYDTPYGDMGYNRMLALARKVITEGRF